MLVWITRSRSKCYEIRSRKPEWNEKHRFWYCPRGFRIVLSAAEAEELLGFQLDLGGCVRRELVLLEPPAWRASQPQRTRRQAQYDQ